MPSGFAFPLFRPSSIPTGLQGYWKLNSNILFVEESDGTQAAQIFSNISSSFRGAGKGLVNRGFNSVYSATFRLQRFGSPTGTFICNIYAASANPSNPGALIASSTTTLDVSTISTSKTSYEFIFSSNVNLSSHQNFIVMCERSAGGTGDGTNHIKIYGTGSNTDSLAWQVVRDSSDVYTNSTGDDVAIVLKSSATDDIGTDSSGNGNNLTNNNTVTGFAQDYWKTGENSADFEKGNTEYLSITDASQTGLDLTGSFTLALWIKQETASFTNNLIRKETAGTGYYLVLDSGTIDFRVENNQFNGPALSVGKWIHVAVTRSATEKCIYVDGNLVATEADTGAASNTSASFVLGGNSAGADTYDGLMKDAAVWNVALTPIQIKSLALGVDLTNFAYRPTNCAVQPTHYWKMNEAVVSGTRAGTVGGVDLTDATTTATKGGYIEGAAPDFASDYLSAPDSSNWDVGTGDFAVSYWIYHDSSVNGRYPFSHGSSPHLALRYASGQWLVYLMGATPIAYTYTQPLNTWEHYVVKRVGTSLTLWIDGVNVASATNSTDVTGGATVFSIGAFNDGTNAHDGRICDFAFWKGGAPTDAEIKSLACAIPLQQTGLVSYWKLDEVSGTRADSLGVNNLTDNNTVASAAGKVSNAADFEKDNSEYLSITDGTQVGLDLVGSDLTFLAFINPESDPGTMYLFSKGGTTSAGYVGYVNSGTGVSALLGFEVEGAGVQESQNEGDIPVGSWTHVAWVFVSGSYIDFFSNGGRRGTANAYAQVITNSADDFRLGDWNNDASKYDGLLDEALIAKRWFRDEEIKTVYNKGLAGKELTSSEIVLGGNQVIWFL